MHLSETGTKRKWKQVKTNWGTPVVVSRLRSVSKHRFALPQSQSFRFQWWLLRTRLNAIQILIMVLFAFKWISTPWATLAAGCAALFWSHKSKGGYPNRRCCIDSFRFDSDSRAVVIDRFFSISVHLWREEPRCLSDSDVAGCVTLAIDFCHFLLGVCRSLRANSLDWKGNPFLFWSFWSDGLNFDGMLCEHIPGRRWLLYAMSARSWFDEIFIKLDWFA